MANSNIFYTPGSDGIPGGILVIFLVIFTPLAVVLGVLGYIGWHDFHEQPYGLNDMGDAREPNGSGGVRPVIHEVWLDVNGIGQSRLPHLLALEAASTRERGKNGEDVENDEDGHLNPNSKSKASTTNGEIQKVGLLWNDLLPISLTQKAVPGQYIPLRRDVLTFIKLPSPSNHLGLYPDYQSFGNMKIHQELCLGVASVH